MERSPAPRFWPTAVPLGLTILGMAVLTAVCVRFEFRSALLYLMGVVLVSLTGDLAAAAGVSLFAFLCLTSFLSARSFPHAVLEPLNLVALLGFVTTAGVITRLVSRWRASFREIQTLQDQLGLVIDSMPAWASVIQPGGAVEFVNRWGLEYTGLRFEDTRGSGWKIAVHPDDRSVFSRARHKAAATGEPFEIEARMRRADGVYRWFLTRVAPLRDERGRIVRWYGVSADIEDRKMAEALLAGEKLLLEMITRGDRLVLILDALCRLVEQRSTGALCSILLLDPDGVSLRHGAAPSRPGA